MSLPKIEALDLRSKEMPCSECGKDCDRKEWLGRCYECRSKGFGKQPEKHGEYLHDAYGLAVKSEEPVLKPDWELRPHLYEPCDRCGKPHYKGLSDCIHCGNSYWYDDDGRRIRS